MANTGSIMPGAGFGIAAGASGETSLAQLGNIPNAPNRDYGVSSVQAKGADGRVYSGQLIQRVYGSGEVRFYLKGEGHSHPLPPGITSLAEAKTYSRQQIRTGAWADLPLGNQAAFSKNSGAGSSAPRMGNIPNLPALDKGVGTVQGKAPDGTVLTGELICRVYSTGYVRYYFKGQNDSHKLPPAITTTADAKVYARQQISSGKWTDFDKGSQSAFDKGRGQSAASTGSNTSAKFSEMLRVDFGPAEPKLKVGSFTVMDRENIAAVNKAKYRGYLPDAKNARFIDFQNNAKGGKDLAEINFSGVSYTKDCNPQTQCAVGLGGFENRGLKVPDGASPEFLESYRKTARLYGQQ